MCKKLYLLSFLSVLIFSSGSYAGPFDDIKDSLKGKKKDVKEVAGPELPEGFKLPDYSPLGKRIAEGEGVYTKNFHWINANGTVSSTNKGWSRVPKDRRHLVYLKKGEAQQEIDAAIMLASCDLPFSKEGEPTEEGGVEKTVEGINYVFYPSGQLKSKGAIKDGPYELYFDNCKLEAKGNWVDYEQHGVWERFSKKDGTLLETTEWRNGENMTKLRKDAKQIFDRGMMTFPDFNIAVCDKYGASDAENEKKINSYIDENLKKFLNMGYFTREEATSAIQRNIDFIKDNLPAFPKDPNLVRQLCN
jgi:antitoxin component YwqK of YwqJK toxin-antitoxin module